MVWHAGSTQNISENGLLFLTDHVPKTDGLIEVNNLDALGYQALAISLTVPAGTNIIVQNDDKELYSGRVEKTLMVKNGDALPNLPNDKAIANVLVPLMFA